METRLKCNQYLKKNIRIKNSNKRCYSLNNKRHYLQSASLYSDSIQQKNTYKNRRSEFKT